jgi:hypothetical protein
MTTKTQTRTKNEIKKSASAAKPKKARTPKRATLKSNKAATKPKTKQAIIRGLVERPDGASIAELTRATKWQAHSVRAALTGLRKAGAEVARTKDDGGTTRYRIEATG